LEKRKGRPADFAALVFGGLSSRRPVSLLSVANIENSKGITFGILRHPAAKKIE